MYQSNPMPGGGNAVRADSGNEQKSNEVGELVKLLSAKIGGISESVMYLESRLSDVLRQTLPTPVGPQAVCSRHSPLGQELQSIFGRADDTHAQVASILKRLEL